MSVVSKIFIIVNLLMTLLLLATMGQKIDYKFNGAYRLLYQEHVKNLVDANQRLTETISARTDQLKAHNARESDVVGRKNEIEAALRTEENTLKTVLGEVNDKVSQKADFQRRLSEKDREGSELESENNRLLEEIRRLTQSRDEQLVKLKRTINSYHATKRRAEDLQAALEAGK